MLELLNVPIGPKGFIKHYRRENVKNFEVLMYLELHASLIGICVTIFGKLLTSAMFLMRHISFYFRATDRGSCCFLLIMDL